MKKIGDWFRRFMQGRYGTDKLNTTILVVGLALSILQIIVPGPWAKWVLMVLSYVCLIIAIFRMFSRNTYKRYQENRKYLVFVEVKLRKSDRFANAHEFVDLRKQERIRTTAAYYLSEFSTQLQPRFDVIEIYAPLGTATSDPEICHWEDAFI